MPRHEYDPHYGYCPICQKQLPGYKGGYHGGDKEQEIKCKCWDSKDSKKETKDAVYQERKT